MDILRILIESLVLFAPATLVSIVVSCLMKTPARAFLVGFVLTALMPATVVWVLVKARPEMAEESPLANVVAPAAIVVLSGVLVGGAAAVVVRRKGK
jgi:hypothetical protein